MTAPTPDPTPRPEADPTRPPEAGWLRRAFIKHPWWFGIAAAVVFVPAIRPLTRRVPDPPPVFGQLQAFASLTDQAGQPFSLERMAGRVWVASFIFTSCPSVCRDVTRAMADLQGRYAGAKVPVELVSFTVDPEIDTPERLTAYGAEHGADFARWHFVTGTEPALRHVIADGFRTHMGDKKPTSEGLVDIAHSTKLVLVDGQGRIRGYYGSDALGVDEVFHRAQHVLAEEGSSR